MVIVNLDFTKRSYIQKIFNKSKRWFKQAQSLEQFAKKLTEIKY